MGKLELSSLRSRNIKNLKKLNRAKKICDDHQVYQQKANCLYKKRERKVHKEYMKKYWARISKI